jgi:hypothetical protein
VYDFGDPEPKPPGLRDSAAPKASRYLSVEILLC